MKLSFSTLGCTEKSLAECLALARETGMAGIEVRGLSGVMDNRRIPEFQPENMAAAKRLLCGSGIMPVVLGTSCRFHTEEYCAAAMAEGAESIRLARELKIPYIRVFGNELTGDRGACTALVTDGIRRLCGVGEENGVAVLLEVHGDFNTVETLTPVVEALGESPYFGLIWDIGHTHTPYGDRWAEFYGAMRPFIRHVHIKDKAGDRLTLPGEGGMPIAQIIRHMQDDGYDGYFSLEWERKWHPELQPVEKALEAFVRLVKG